jgi:hypothetical protein
LNWVLLRVILGDPQGFEFLWEKQVAKSSGEGGEAVVVACLRGLLAMYYLNFAAGIVAAVRDAGDVAVCVASAFAITATTSSPARTL